MTAPLTLPAALEAMVDAGIAAAQDYVGQMNETGAYDAREHCRVIHRAALAALVANVDPDALREAVMILDDYQHDLDVAALLRVLADAARGGT